MDEVYDGLYTYFIKNLTDGKLYKSRVRCEIISETAKSYRIKLRFCHREIWVRKKSIFRSYLNKKNGICSIYKLSPAVNSCKACLQNCFYKYIFYKE